MDWSKGCEMFAAVFRIRYKSSGWYQIEYNTGNKGGIFQIETQIQIPPHEGEILPNRVGMITKLIALSACARPKINLYISQFNCSF